MDPLPVTLCINTRNAAGQLEDCIASARSWVSEIVVVDMDSEDATCELARSAGAKVVAIPAAGYVEPGRQACIDAASQPWILMLDVDERAGPQLRETVASYVSRNDVAGVWLPRKNYQFGWWLATSGIWPDWQLRLFRRDRTTWPGDRIHAAPQISGRVERASARAENAIVHHSFPSIASWIATINRYTDLEAEQMDNEGRAASLQRLLAMPAMRFGQLYIGQRGYRSGRYGLTVALLALCYQVLAELKLWERRLGRGSLPAGAVPEP